MTLEEIRAGQGLCGIEPSQNVSVVAAVPIGEGTVQLICRTPDGAMRERLLGRGEEASVDIAAVGRPFSFDGDGAAFQLACEAKPHMRDRLRDASGRQRTLIVFPEHRDALNYLHARIAGVLGNPEAIVTIHGQALDHDHLRALVDRNAPALETMSPERLVSVKEGMDKAEARRLQPSQPHSTPSSGDSASGPGGPRMPEQTTRSSPVGASSNSPPARPRRHTRGACSNNGGRPARRERPRRPLPRPPSDGRSGLVP